MSTSTALPQLDETLLATTRYLAGTDRSRRRGRATARRCSPAGPGRTSSPTCPATPTRFTRVLRPGPGGRAGVDVRRPGGRATPTSRPPSSGRPRRSRRGRARLHRAADRGAARAATADLDDAVHAGAGRRPHRSRCDTVGPRRRTEVEVHHADLGIGYTAGRLAGGLLVAPDQAAAGRAGRGGGPSMVLSSTDVGGLWKFGDGPGPGDQRHRRATWPGGWSAAATARADLQRRRAPEPGKVSDELPRQGHPGGPPDVRELAEPDRSPRSSVGDMDNNTYLLRCRPPTSRCWSTRPTSRPDPASWSARTGCARWSPPTSTGTTSGRSPRWSTATGRRRRSPARTTPRASRCPSTDPVSATATRVPVGDCTLEVIHLVGHTPGLDRAAVRRPRRHAAPLHRRLAVPRRRRQHLRRRRGLRVA